MTKPLRTSRRKRPHLTPLIVLSVTGMLLSAACAPTSGRSPGAAASSTDANPTQYSRTHGLAQDVEPMEMPELEMWTPGFGAVSLMEGAPRSGAARVFINWLLSRSGQEALLKRGAEDNSRRTDVPVVSQGSLPKPEHLHQYVRNDEAWEPTRIAAEQLAQRLLK
jgi:hypothetical protein